MTVNKPISNQTYRYIFSIVAVIVSCVLGFFWAIVPLFGWSEYSLEGAMISCSVEWNKV